MIFSATEKQVMLSFTSMERQSLFQFLSGVMNIDGNVQNTEKEELQYIITLMRITNADVEASRRLDFATMQSTLSGMTIAKRKILAKSISAIVVADDHIHPKEEQFVSYYMDPLGLDSNWLMPNYGNPFPEINLRSMNLVETNLRNVSALRRMFSNASFCKSYFGSDCFEIRNRLNNCSENQYIQDQIHKYLWGRELQWFIEKKDGTFLGFIHVTRSYPALPNKWVLGFGVSPEVQNQGIMSEVLPAVINYLKCAGLDQTIYAVSESFNIPCHKLFRKLHYGVTESTCEMSDQWAGTRMMRLFTIQ